MKFPTHITMTVTHNDYKCYYLTVEQYLNDPQNRDLTDVTDADRAEMLRTGEVWEVHWYPRTPVGFNWVAAATLERAMAAACELVGEVP